MIHFILLQNRQVRQLSCTAVSMFVWDSALCGWKTAVCCEGIERVESALRSCPCKSGAVHTRCIVCGVYGCSFIRHLLRALLSFLAD